MDTNSSVQVIVNNNNRVVNEQTSLRNFRLYPDTRSAVFANGTATSNYESKGKTVTGSSIKGLVLPELYVGRVVGNVDPVLFQIAIDTMKPLVYSGSNNKYTGQFEITLVEDSKDVLERMVLEEPVNIAISSGSGRMKIVPSVLQINHTNLPATIVRVVDSSANDPVPIFIKTDFKREGYLTSLKKEALLLIKTPSRSIQGLGVQAISITALLEGYAGDDSVYVTFAIEKGSLEPENMYITKDRPGKIILRSEGVGPVTLTASANGFLDDHKEFNYIFPWMFIIFSLAGGILGALVRYAMDKPKKGLFYALGLGLITGFVGAILYYVLGIELFTVSLSKSLNEFAVLGISFLVSLFWQQIFKFLGSLVRSKPI